MIVQAPEMRVNQMAGVKGFHIKKEHKLFDHIKQYYKIKSDVELAELLDISPPELSRFRNNQKRPTARLILAVYDMTKMPIEKIRELLK